ncbi:MAG: hypothetical protein M0C28_06820 [Candidatus Moduliflexus flocculans]|nr:hypothetical protein [Candidatus Moduliflexus flocculans]MCK7576815.1 hypothetical protein [Chromatiales bacterium]MCK7577101.1 hypothetical protein [Chromatiales bacterium]
MTIKTLHGRFEFHVQRFRNHLQPTEKDRTYFDLTDQFQKMYVSDRLQELAGYYSNRLSYANVAELIHRVTGDRQLSDQKIWQIARDKTVEISQAWQVETEKWLNGSELPFPKIQEKIDLYDSKSREILVFEDAIQVRGQKENRVHKHELIKEKPDKIPEIKKSSPVFTNVVMLEKKDKDFDYVVAPVNEQGQEIVSLPDVLKSRVIQEYGAEPEPLPVVAITDGAQVIRQHLYAVFGVMLVIILDWYHLGKKVRDLMSMIARNKEEKTIHLKFMFYHLWRGEVSTVLDYLETKVQSRNEEKHLELIGYLNKHRDEIIDYRRRKKAGKMIGSGYIEKGCDQVIGYRQKKKGMSWRETGSRGLGILKVAELNHQWERFWFPMEAANDSTNLQLASNL